MEVMAHGRSASLLDGNAGRILLRVGSSNSMVSNEKRVEVMSDESY